MKGIERDGSSNSISLSNIFSITTRFNLSTSCIQGAMYEGRPEGKAGGEESIKEGGTSVDISMEKL